MAEAGDHGTVVEDVEQVEMTGGTGGLDPLLNNVGDEVLPLLVAVLPLRTMSRINVSMGVLPTSRKKKTCSMTCEDTVRSEGNLKSSLPKRVGWFGYCVRQYSSRAHCDFSCNCSMAWALVNPGASGIGLDLRPLLGLSEKYIYLWKITRWLSCMCTRHCRLEAP